MPLWPPDAVYPATSHTLLNEDDQVTADVVELETDEEANLVNVIVAADPPPVVVDTQVQWIHFVLGCSVLLPWNVMITSTPFFLSRLVDSSWKTTFASYLSTTFTASKLIFLTHATFVSKQTPPSHQIRRCILGLSFLIILLTFSTFIRVGPSLFVTFVLLNGATQAALGSYLLTSVIAVASLFGPLAIQAVMSGEAAVAVAVSGVQVISSVLFLWTTTPESIAANAVDGSAEQGSARLFFAFSTCLLVAALMARNLLVTKPAYKTLVAPLEEKYVLEAGAIDERQPLISSGPSTFTSEKTRILRVAKNNMIYEIAVSYVFIVTLAVFPAITTSVMPTNSTTPFLLFNAIHFLVFNIGDFLGRYLCAIPSLVIWSAKWLLALSLSRTIFIPIFLMCNVQTSGSPTTPPIINSDALFMIILFALGFSNGYLSSLCMMFAPSLEHNPRLKGRKDDVDVAATVTSFALVGGLVVGSVASFAVTGAVCRCNPFKA